MDRRVLDLQYGNPDVTSITQGFRHDGSAKQSD